MNKRFEQSVHKRNLNGKQTNEQQKKYTKRYSTSLPIRKMQIKSH